MTQRLLRLLAMAILALAVEDLSGPGVRETTGEATAMGRQTRPDVA
jgi:hypothetical protein